MVGTTKMIKGYNNHTIAAGSPASPIIVSRPLQGHKENRCIKCKRLLFKGDVIRVEIKCKRCGKINTFKGRLSAGGKVINEAVLNT